MSDKKMPTNTPASDTSKSDDNSRIADLTHRINESNDRGVFDGSTISNTKQPPEPKGGDKGKT